MEANKMGTVVPEFDTLAQCEAFDEYLVVTPDGRQQGIHAGVFGYSEDEWVAFQYGWNAAKEHYNIVSKNED